MAYSLYFLKKPVENHKSYGQAPNQNPFNTCYFGASTSLRKRHDLKELEKKKIGRKGSCKDPKNYDLLCNVIQTYHCVKCVQVRSFFWSIFSHI